MNNKLAGFYLVVVAALWGLTFPLIEESMEQLDPFLFVSLRFTLAAIPLLPYFLKRVTMQSLSVGACLGLLNSGAFITQTIGLQSVNASRAAFLTGAYVLLVPLLSPFLRMGAPTAHDLISALICCLGIFVLTGCDIGLLTVGDGWVAACTIFIALSIIYIGKHSKNNFNPYMLASSQIIMTALFSWIPTLIFSDLNFSSFATSQAMTSLVICSFFATILAIILQSKYQKYVSLQNTALIFSLEPLFAAFFDAALTERLPSGYTFFGGLIIMASIIYLEILKPHTTESTETAVSPLLELSDTN